MRDAKAALTISDLSGEAALDGRTIQLRITPRGARVSPFRLTLTTVEEVQALVTILLVLGSHAAARADPPLHLDFSQSVPLPVDSIAVGQTVDGSTNLMLGVGPAALTFTLPEHAAEPLGQALLSKIVGAAQRHHP